MPNENGKTTPPGAREPRSGALAFLERLVRVHDDELAALGWSCLYFFFLLSSYYILRPVRDEMGIAGGVRNLPWLYLGTLTGMLVLNPLFAWLVIRLPRRRFIPLVNRFFLACLLAFFLLMRFAPQEWLVWAGRAFFVWVSIFNLFVVSVFWGFMADMWRSEQGKRLFGMIGVGGTAGAIVGAAITASLVEWIGVAALMLISAALLEGATFCAARLSRRFVPGTDTPQERASPVGLLNGILLTARSPYLLGICAYMFLYTVMSTFLWFIQQNIVAGAIDDGETRTALFARMDLAVNVLTIVVQVFFTGRIIRVLGVGLTLALLPLVSFIGFGTLGLYPTLAVVVTFQVLRRASNFALARPAREVLYTPLGRDEKYKAKSFIDTFVYRGGDAVGAAAFGALTKTVTGLAGIAFIAVPLAAAWAVVGLALGRRQAKLAAERGD